jgi:HlyD family secretion protein
VCPGLPCRHEAAYLVGAFRFALKEIRVIGRSRLATVFAFGITVGACAPDGAPPGRRASGYVEATEVRVATKVGGRVQTVAAAEGARVAAGDVLVTLSTTDADLALARAQAERAQADANLRLLRAGARPEDVRQAEAQHAAAVADERAAAAELGAARQDEDRYQQLVDRRAGAVKQRDDAVARRELAEARVRAATDRAAAASAAVSRLRAGARTEEIDAARGRIAAIDAEIAILNDRRTEASIAAPSAGVVTSRLVEPGELVTAGAPLVILMDLDRAWVNAYVEETVVPTLKLSANVTIVTDAGDRLPGQIAFIAPRAEFTPRNVQTAAERARLVYRVRVTLDNRAGILKPGMPVDVELAPGS